MSGESNGYVFYCPGVEVVSIHARHKCRANPMVVVSMVVVGYVSIHARHKCRANPASFTVTAPAVLFQSTPGINVGRILIFGDRSGQVVMFQSTPGINVGRIHHGIGSLAHSRAFQSTPGINVGRIPDWHLISYGDNGFQSTPGINVGRIPFATRCARRKGFFTLWREPLNTGCDNSPPQARFRIISI